MKFSECLIIGISLVLSNNYELTLAFGVTLGNIKALSDWSHEVHRNISEAYKYDLIFKNGSFEFALTEINHKLASEIQEINTIVEQKVNSIGCSLFRHFPAVRQCDNALRDLAMNLDIIDRFYRDLVIFTKNEGAIDDVTLKRWATSITSYTVGDLPDVLWKIHRSIVPGYDFQEGLFMLISRTTQEGNREICDIGTSPQYCLHELYQTILDRQMKGYMMTLYAYGYLAIYEKGNFSTEMKIANDEFDVTSKKLLEAVMKSMEHAPRDLRRCDPKEHERNKTFLELERLMQAYIVNQADVSTEGACDADCSGLQRGAKYGKYSEKFPQNRPCDGDLIWCSYGGHKMHVCQLPGDNVRRYEWFENEYGINGIETSCNDGEIHNFSGWSRASAVCNYCVCTCMHDEVGRDLGTIRTISFMDQLSDISQNMVLTGLRFISQYGVIHVQILQAPLLEQGKINTRKLEWLPVDKLHYLHNASKQNHQNTYHVWTKDGSSAKYGKHYGAINRHQRQINLDDILLPDGYVVTGVRFKYEKGQSISKDRQPIRLEVHGTPFDYGSGRLVPTNVRSSTWFNSDNISHRSNKYYRRKRREIMMKNPGNPINYANHAPNSEPNTYIKFTSTDVKKDAGQATVPFFDALQIGGEVNFPLSGIGLYHRGSPSSGGFLAFRIFGIDLTKYIKVSDDDDVS